MLRFIFAVLLLSFANVLSAAEPTWKAGFAAVAITPTEPMWMSGYAARTKPSEGKDTELWAKVMVLEDAKKHQAILVTLDLVGLNRDFAVKLREAIVARDKDRLTMQNVALSMSHTHSGPVVGTTLRSMYFIDAEQSKKVDDYSAKLPSLILQAVDTARANLQPATVTWGVGSCGFAVNRRENKEPEVAKLRAEGKELKGPVDHDAPVLAVRNEQGKLLGVVFGYACHATTLDYYKWSGDYPGYAMLELEKSNPGAVAMFYAGCGADQNPIPRRSVELAKDYGQQLASSVNAVLAKPMKPLAPTFGGLFSELAIPLESIPTRDALVQESTSANKYVAARAKHLLKKLEAEGELRITVPYPVQTWQLGELSWVFLGGEVVVDYALRLKKELGPNLWVTAYANDVMAYIPSVRVLKEGGYEGGGAMVYYGIPSAWSPKVEAMIVTEVHRQVTATRRDVK